MNKITSQEDGIPSIYRSELTPTPVCRHCQKPGRFVRIRNFDTSNSAVFECSNAQCDHWNLLFHVDDLPKPKGQRTTAALLTILEFNENRRRDFLPEKLRREAREAIEFDAAIEAKPAAVNAEMRKALEAASVNAEMLKALEFLLLAVFETGEQYPNLEVQTWNAVQCASAAIEKAKAVR